MPRKTSRTHARGEESRQRILYAALEIAVRRGYDGTTIGAVGAATGLPASSLYWHFANKDQLLAAALDLSYRRWRRIAPSWGSTDTPGAGGPAPARAELIGVQLRQAAQGFARQPGFWRFGLMLALEQRPVDTAARTRFLEIRTDAVGRMRAWWEEAGALDPARGDPDAPRLLAQLTLAAMDGLFIAGQGRVDHHTATGGATTDSTVELLTAGIDGAAERLSSGRCPAVEGPAPLPRRSGATDPAPGATGRDRVLHAAAEIAAERGYEGATISRVCARAGLPPTSVYWAFTTKDELLAAALEHSFERWLADRPAWPAPPTDGSWPDVLRTHLARTLRSLSESPNFLRIGLMLLLELRETEPAARAVFLRIRRSLDDQVAEWLAAALGRPATAEGPGLPRRLATLLMAFSDGLFLSHQLDSVTWHPDLFADLLVTALESASASTVRTTAG